MNIVTCIDCSQSRAVSTVMDLGHSLSLALVCTLIKYSSSVVFSLVSLPISGSSTASFSLHYGFYVGCASSGGGHKTVKTPWAWWWGRGTGNYSSFLGRLWREQYSVRGPVTWRVLVVAGTFSCESWLCVQIATELRTFTNLSGLLGQTMSARKHWELKVAGVVLNKSSIA